MWGAGFLCRRGRASPSGVSRCRGMWMSLFLDIFTKIFFILSPFFSVSMFLFLAMPIARLLGQKGLQMMTKLTGLILTAIAAQIIFSGVNGFLKLTRAG